MSRALRYTPPLGNRGLIVRPRLLARLRTRFDRRLTAVVAPAGFGKTTLLAQAVQENALSPLCEDRWLTCQRDDTALSFLAAGAFAAVGVSAPVPEDPGDAALTVAEAIWSAAPHHVALFLDDAHLVEAASPGGRFLTGLVEELPRNGHVVIASRPPLPLRASRLVANGDAVVVGERELHFRDDEMAAFAASRHVPRERPVAPSPAELRGEEFLGHARPAGLLGQHLPEGVDVLGEHPEGREAAVATEGVRRGNGIGEAGELTGVAQQEGPGR